MFSVASVCLCLSVFVNTITSERVNIGWWNLGVGALYKNLGRFRIWGHSPLGAHPAPQMWRWLRHRENQCRLSGFNVIDIFLVNILGKTSCLLTNIINRASAKNSSRCLPFGVKTSHYMRILRVTSSVIIYTGNCLFLIRPPDMHHHHHFL